MNDLDYLIVNKFNWLIYLMKFGHLFEFHKIPEWYDEYVRYRDLRD